MGMIHGIWTLLLLALFVGIVIWAWSGARKKQFEAAARLPLEDDDSDERSNGRLEFPGDSD